MLYHQKMIIGKVILCTTLDIYSIPLVFLYTMRVTVRMHTEFDKVFNRLKEGDHLKNKIHEAAGFMMNDDNRGDKIRKELWPRQLKKIGITNLWRYAINNHRLIYTITFENNEKIY